MDYRKAYKLSQIFMTVGILPNALIALAGIWGDPSEWEWIMQEWYLIVMGCGAALFFSGFIIMCFRYRCPHCSARLPLLRGIPTYCPHCGEKLE